MYNYTTWQKLADKAQCHPLFTLKEYIGAADKSASMNLVHITNANLDSDDFGSLQLDKSLVFVLETNEAHGMADQRAFFFKMEEMQLDVPVIVKRSYGKEHGPWTMDHGQEETTLLQLYASTDLGALLVDGFGDGIWIDAPDVDAACLLYTSPSPRDS